MKDKVIVALDYVYEKDAQDLVLRLDDAANYYKVGLELFLNSRGSIIDFLKEKDKKIFLDLKFHDIPNTVAQAAKWATGLGVDMFNVHAVGGSEMIKTSMDLIRETSIKENIQMPTIIGVTVLTSFDEAGYSQLGFKQPIKESALNLAKLCYDGGLDGVVCSPHEVQIIKEHCGTGFQTVCPGIRPTWAAKGDQKRITTPAQAVEMGVDYMVIGRPITKAEDPKVAALKILDELRGM